MAKKNREERKKLKFSWKIEQVGFPMYGKQDDLCNVQSGLHQLGPLSFFYSPASLATTVWMEYSLEEFVNPVNATAMQLSVIFMAFALWVYCLNLECPLLPIPKPSATQKWFLRNAFSTAEYPCPYRPQRKFVDLSACH